jgi:hypothetical protein
MQEGVIMLEHNCIPSADIICHECGNPVCAVCGKCFYLLCKNYSFIDLGED